MGKINTDEYTTSSTITRDEDSVEYVQGKHDSNNGVKRDKKGYWLKGQSGNPKGRPPKGKSVAEKFRENPTGEKVLQQIFEIASTLGEDNQHSDALQCAKLVIERLVPALKSSELKMSSEDSGVIIMPPQIPVESDDE
tara:strand:+ start:1445 stop:1858 length:414 start_codon:yes stop_codon:yes gene_type:complete